MHARLNVCLNKHEDEHQEHDQHPGEPVGRSISPVHADSVREKADVQRGPQETVADEQQPQLPVPADGAVTAVGALGRAADRDRLDAALLMAGVAYYVLERALIAHHGADSALGIHRLDANHHRAARLSRNDHGAARANPGAPPGLPCREAP